MQQRVQKAQAALKLERELSGKYGELQEPLFPVKDFELGKDGKVIKNPDLQIIKSGEKIKTLDKSKRYIWSIDKEGNLRIGLETPVPPGPKTRLGHPTLVEGGAARISGEIKFNPKTKQWRINDSSGRYSNIPGRHPARKNEILDNARELFQESGLNVGVIEHNIK
jgi:hypothetical protein